MNLPVYWYERGDTDYIPVRIDDAILRFPVMHSYNCILYVM